MIFNGTIRNFGQYDDNQLMQMKADLKIGMSLPMLKTCAAYFREKAFRNPFVREFLFLDSFVQKALQSPVSVAPTELLTNDDFVAKTYADLIAKRRATNPDAQKPVSLEEAFNLMGCYLERLEKARLFPHEAYFFEDLRRNRIFSEAENLFAVKNASCGLRRAFYEKPPLEATDLLVVLTAAKDASPIKASASLNAFWSDAANLCAVKAVRVIGECGILFEALQMSEGVKIDLAALAWQEEPDLSSLLSSYVGGYLVRIGAKDYDFLAKNAKSLGLHALSVGTVSDPTAVAITENEQIVLAWSSEFIRTLFEISPVSLQLADEVEGESAKVECCRKSAGECAYLEPLDNDLPQTKAVCGNNLYTFAYSSPKGAFFRNAINTALASVITSCTCGVPYTEQRLAVHLNLPFALSRTDAASTAMSTILGLYRIEAELAIPMAFGKLSHDACVTAPEIGVFGLAKGNACADRFCGEGHRLYCVMPEYDACGVPSFDALRGFLNWLTELAQSGALKSARVFSNQTIFEALQEMATDRFEVCFANGVAEEERTLPLAVILETDAEISAELVGTIQERSRIDVEKKSAELPARAQCLLPVKDPAVLIYAMPDDHDAQILAATLEKGGATTYICSSNDDPLSVASTLYGVQTLILCEKAELPSTAEVDFAVKTLARANGLLLRIKGEKCAQSALSFVDLDALSKQNIEQICKITNN